MPVHPPKDLSRHVAVKQILAAAGITVNNSVPQVAACPVCLAEQTLSIYQDPIIAGKSLWLHCSNCDFRGDAIDTYARVNEISDPKSAITHAIRHGYFNGPVNEFGGDVIDSYVNNYILRRRQVAERWEKLTTALAHVDPRSLRRAQAAHLWYGWGKAPRERLARFLGGGTRKDLIRIFNDPSVTPKEGYGTAFVLNYQDVPGRTCAFEIIGEGGRMMKHYKPFHDRRRREGGLAMLDALDAFEGTVFAVSDPGVALRMHSRHFHDWTKPLKLVLYNPRTDLAWRAVKADRVILWTNKSDAAAINQARKVENGYVTRNPNLEDYNHLNGVAFPQITGMMERNAKPWREYLLARVLRRNIDPEDARGLIRNLQLTTKERREILDLCPGPSRSRVEELFEAEQSARIIIHGGKNIIERAEGWFHQKGGVGEELLSDARPYLSKEITEKDTGDVRWEGVVMFDRKEVPFSSDLNDVEDDPTKWLRRLLVRAELGTPTVDSTWAKKYMPNLMRQVSAYDKISVSRRIGVRDDGSILFPTFHIIDSQITAARAVLPRTDMPASDLRVPRRESNRFDMELTPAHPMFVVLASTFIANLLAEFCGEGRTPIAIVGEHGSVARESMRAFTGTVGMNTHALRRGTEKEIDKLRSALDSSGYPVFIDPDREGLIQFWPAGNEDHAYVAVTPLEASALALNGGWVFVNAPGFDMEPAQMPAHDAIFFYLADLQRRGFEVPREQYFCASILNDFLKWYEVYLRKDMGPVREKAQELMRAASAPGTDLIRLSIQLYRSGRLLLERGQVIGAERVAKAGILIDEVNDQVFIAREGLIAAIRRAKLPWPDLRPATANLAARKLLHPCGKKLDGWVIPRSVWEGSVEGCLG
jgi:hypothetical protein